MLEIVTELLERPIAGVGSVETNQKQQHDSLRRLQLKSGWNKSFDDGNDCNGGEAEDDAPVCSSNAKHDVGQDPVAGQQEKSHCRWAN